MIGFGIVLGAVIAVAATFLQSGVAGADKEPDPRMKGSGQVTATSTVYQFSIDLRLKDDDDEKFSGSFSLRKLGSPSTDRFKLTGITSLVFSDDQSSSGPCGPAGECDADWNTATLAGTGKIGKVGGNSITLTALDGGTDSSLDRLTVEIKDPSGAVVESFVGIPTKGKGLQARKLLPLPDPGPNIVRDDFTDVTGTPLESHAPNVDFLGGGWDEQAYKEWFVKSGEVTNLAGIGTPFYAVSDAGLINATISSDVTWTGGEVGLVFRYKDAGNHWEFIYDGKKRLELRKVTAGVTSLVAKRNFKWGKSGKTRLFTVIVDDDEITARVGKSKKFKITDAAHQGNTQAGLYFQLRDGASIDNFAIASLGGVPGLPPPPPPLPAPSASLVFDSFTAGSAVDLASHAPEKDTVGGGWSTGGGLGSGTWTAGTSTAAETSGADTDLHATIDTGSTDIDIRVDITWNDPAVGSGSPGIAGLVLRYKDEGNWTKVWFDGNTELILGQLSTPGTFKELGRASVDWRPGETHRLRARRNGDSMRIYEDTDSLLMLRIVSDGATSTRAGMFARRVSATTFDNFVAVASAALPEPDPAPPPPGPTPTPTPAPPGIPAGADFYDSFTGFNGNALAGRTPDLDPLGLGWTLAGGFWQLNTASAREFRGTERDFRASIDAGVGNQLVDAALSWNSGRAGMVFRYSDESNWMMVWFDGNDLILAKNVGGQFKEIGRVKKFKWGKPGRTHRIRIATSGRRGRIFVDGTLRFRFTEEELQLNTRAGVFYRAVIGSLFDDFTVTGGSTQPVPQITSLSPNPQSAGAGDFILTVSGNSLTRRSVVEVGGSARTTTYVSPQSVTAALLGADIASAGAISITVNNGSDGGGTSASSTLTLVNPVPAISDPSFSKEKNATDLSLTVNGSNFVATSVGRIDGADRATTFVSGSQVVLTLLSSDVAAFATSTVTINNPPVGSPPAGGGDSNGVTLTIENAVPVLSSLQTSPTVVAAGDSSGTLTVLGSGFASGAQIIVNGVSHSATSTTATSTQASLTSADLASAGQVPILVFNPTPGGGTSTAALSLPVASVYDTFTDTDATNMTAHTPDAKPSGSAWSVEKGDANAWTISSGQAKVSTSGGGDHRLVIDGGAADTEVLADITWSSGLAGLVIRHDSGDLNWVMAWFDGDLVLAQLSGGAFSELGRLSAYAWGSAGTTHRIRLAAQGTTVTVSVDGAVVLTRTATSSATATGAGLFAKLTTANRFDNFVVVPLTAP